jgi:hypothetical protein
MPIEISKFRQWLRIAVLVGCLALEGLLVWYNYFGRSGSEDGVLLSFASIALLLALSVTGILPVPAGLKIPFFGIWPSLSDTVKSLISFVSIFLWTPLAKQLVPNTPVGATIVLAPDVLFLLAALVYLSNGLSRGN